MWFKNVVHEILVIKLNTEKYGLFAKFCTKNIVLILFKTYSMGNMSRYLSLCSKSTHTSKLVNIAIIIW